MTCTASAAAASLDAYCATGTSPGVSGTSHPRIEASVALASPNTARAQPDLRGGTMSAAENGVRSARPNPTPRTGTIRVRIAPGA
mgnify:CR=1 FL=1